MGKQTWKAGNMLYPVPAVMVSCQKEGEKPNIITVAWAGTVCTSPAMVSISVRPERYSYDIIKESREFVINLVTKELVYATDYCGVRSGRDVDKFKEMNLTPYESVYVNAPSIKESPVNIECRVVDILEYGIPETKKVEYLSIKVGSSTSMDLTSNVLIDFGEPITHLNDTAIHLYRKKDTLWVDEPHLLRQRKHALMGYELLGEWKPGMEYKMVIDSAAFTGLYGLHTKRQEATFKFKTLEQ